LNLDTVCDVTLPVYIVALRMVGSEVSAPAFFPAHRRMGDEAADRQDG
jgi:hypothetical protein